MYGGGIFGSIGAQVDINYSTISNNEAPNGGGIALLEANAELVNSTVSGNTATTGSGGGIYATKYLEMYNTTISNNSADSGAGGGVFAINQEIISKSTIISGNTASTYNNVSHDSGLAADYSLLGTDVSVTSGSNNQIYNDPGLQALADNGCAVEAGISGATECVKTHELNTTSDAIDNGSNPLSLTYDERGNVARSIDGNLDPGDSPDYAQTDIGAYELQLQDFGDAPSTYGEAKHFASANLMLSTSVTLGDIDHDDANQPNAGATGDDSDGGDDEAGVEFSSPVGGDVAEVVATVSVTNDTGAVATVCGWLNPWDSNGDPEDGSFTGDPRKCATVADNNGSATEVVLSWDESDGLLRADGSTFARFRVCSTASECNVPTGTAATGEAEDYQINFDFDPTQVTIGEVGVAAETTDDFLDQFGHETSVLLELLRHWDP
ncbi:MAG: hypothetical protein GY794_25695, partial [bacterium]|nr:hypothetical protein [bacterium]